MFESDGMGKAVRRGVATALLLCAMPLHAQSTNSMEAIPPGQADLGETVGPAELRDFSLGGDQQPSNEPRQPAAAPPQTPPRTSTPAPPERSVPTRQPTTPGPVPSPSLAGPADAPAPEIIEREGSPGSMSPLPPISEAPIDSADRPTRTLRLPGEAGGGEQPWWPWALGLVAALGGAFLLLRRRQDRLAAAGGMPLAEPDPPPAPEPAPAAAPPASPVFSIDLQPLRASLSESEFVIDYAMTVANKGKGLARELSIDVAMVMAGSEQEERIGKFVAHPPAERTIAVQALNSYGQAPLRGSVRLSGPELTAINLDGRQLLLPTLVFLPRHAGGKADPIRFVIGRKPQGSDKLAPMRADKGPRSWRDLEARLA